MNDEPSTPLDEQLLPWLIACDNALAAGTIHEAPPGAEPPSELRRRLQGDVACIQLLRQVLPRRAPAESASTPPGLPLRRLGRFEIHRELGHGAFGMVFLATDRQLGREVALKVPRPEGLLTTELRERFVREARAAAGLDHPNVVPVYEAGAEGPLCYIASAYCPGVTLAEWLANRSEAVPLRLAAALVATLAAAVQHAHERGVIHRDLKPSNVLLQGRPRDPADANSTVKEPGGEHGSSDKELEFVPRITDFGLAKLTVDASGQPGEGDGVRTQSGALLGTPNYMAPEQASGKNREIGPAADVYALGVILYELLTGRPPFRGETVLDTLEQVRTREPLSPRRLRPKLSRDLETICLKCLAKEPRKRYDSASALADDLNCYLAGAPIHARPIRALERGIKWARRKPAQAMLMVVSALATIALLAVVLGYNAALADSNTQLKDSNSQLQRTNEDLSDALAAKETERARAEEKQGEANDNLRLLLLSLDDYAIKVSQNDRLKAHDLEGLRKELLQMPMKMYRELLRKHPENPDLQEAYAKILQHNAKLAQELGAKKEAIESSQEAIDLYQKLNREHPNIPQYQIQQSVALTGLAIADKDSRQSGGRVEKAFLEALALRKQLVLEHPTEPAYQSAVAETLNNLAVLYEETGHVSEAEAALRDAQKVFEQLTGAYPGVEAFQEGLAATHYNLGRVYEAKYDLKSSVDSFSEACRHWRELNRAHPAMPAHQDNLAKALTHLGIDYGLIGRPDKGMDAYAEVERIYRKLAADHPKVPGYQSSLAQFHYNRGQLYNRLGRPDEAKQAYGKAIEEYEKLIRAYPDVREYRFALSMAQCNLGLLFCNPNQAGWEKAAGDLLNAARKSQEKLVDVYPDEGKYRGGLGVTYSSLGLMKFLQKEPRPALDWFNLSVKMLKTVLEQGPQQTEARQFLKTAYERRVQTLLQLSDYKEVLRDLDRYLELDAKGKNDYWRFLHAYSLAQTGEHGLAMAEAKVLIDRPALPAEMLYNLACVCSLCSAAVQRDNELTAKDREKRADQYAARAVEFLTKARTAGFFKPTGAIEEMRKDKDLHVLRQRPDFQKLLLSLQPKEQPKGTP